MKRLASMAPIDTIWLVLNARSGSNEDGAIAELREHCERRNLSLAREICFPGEDLPTASELERAGAFPEALHRDMVQMGIFGITLPDGIARRLDAQRFAVEADDTMFRAVGTE